MTKFDLYENPQARLWKEKYMQTLETQAALEESEERARLWKEKYMQASKKLEALETSKRELEIEYSVERNRWREDCARFSRYFELADDVAQFNALPWYKKMFFKFDNV